MYQVIARQGRKVIHKQTFSNEREAWDFFDLHCDSYACEFRNINILKAA